MDFPSLRLPGMPVLKEATRLKPCGSMDDSQKHRPKGGEGPVQAATRIIDPKAARSRDDVLRKRTPYRWLAWASVVTGALPALPALSAYVAGLVDQLVTTPVHMRKD